MTPGDFKKNTLTFLSLIFISASEFLVFPLLSSEGQSSSEAAIFAILVIGFFIGGMYTLFNTQIIIKKNNLDIISVKRNKIFAIILSLGVLTNLAVAGFTFYIFFTDLYGGILFVKEVSKPQVHDPNIPKQAQKAGYEKENDPNFGQNSYVYWVHVKGQYENGCCTNIYPNPSRPIADDSYYLELKLETQPDPRGYEGVVCSPDCDGKVIWSGPVTFSEGKTEWNTGLVRGQPNVVTVKSYNLVLTPTGQLNGKFDELQKKLKSPSGFYEVIVKDAGCRDDSCIVKRKIFVGRSEGNNEINAYITANDNIKLGGSYDVYLCDTSCSKNHPREDWNPRVCKDTTGDLWLTFSPDYYIGLRPDRCD